MPSNSDFIGKDKVIGVARVEDFFTPSGKEVVKVLFENSKSKLMTKEIFDLLVSEKVSDDNEIQKKKFEALIPELIKVIINYDIHWFEVSALLRSIHESLQMRFDRASSYLWHGNDDKYFTAGVVPSDFWTLLEAQQILNNASKNDPEKGNNIEGLGGVKS